MSLFSENEKIGCFGEVERGRKGGRESVMVWKERKNQIKVGQKKVDEIGLKLRKVLSVWREEEEKEEEEDFLSRGVGILARTHRPHAGSA